VDGLDEGNRDAPAPKTRQLRPGARAVRRLHAPCTRALSRPLAVVLGGSAVVLGAKMRGAAPALITILCAAGGGRRAEAPGAARRRGPRGRRAGRASARRVSHPGRVLPSIFLHRPPRNWCGRTKMSTSASLVADTTHGSATTFAGSLIPSARRDARSAGPGGAGTAAQGVSRTWHVLGVLVLRVDDFCQLAPIDDLFKHPHAHLRVDTVGVRSIQTQHASLWGGADLLLKVWEAGAVLPDNFRDRRPPVARADDSDALLSACSHFSSTNRRPPVQQLLLVRRAPRKNPAGRFRGLFPAP